MRGTTLVELITVLVILGILTGIAGLAIRSLRPLPESARAQVLWRARAGAIRSGRPVSVPGEGGAAIRFNPDGRATGEGVDFLTGEPIDAQR
jgi:prepilin-type N-terminal cleavage/methylation domain-containing protein